MKRYNDDAKAFLIASAIAVIMFIALPIVGAVIVANNPEAIGDWFRRLIGG